MTDELLAIVRDHEHLSEIEKIMLHPSLPVDIRHNSKLSREQLAVWAAQHSTPTAAESARSAHD